MKKSELKGRKFKAVRTVKGWAIEDIPLIRQTLQERIKDIPEAEMTEDENGFHLNNGQTFHKPVQAKELEGVLDCGPSFAKFEGVRIEYKNMSIEGNIMETENAIYEIKGEL